MKILFVQEQSFLATAFKLILLKLGYNLITSIGDLPAHKLVKEINPQLIITNISEPAGLTFLIEGKKRNIPVIVITKNGQEEFLELAFSLGANDYVSLPICLPELALRASLLIQQKLQAVA